MKKSDPYVVQCKKGNNNRFCFGFRHKAGQYVTFTGEGSFDLNDAYIYRDEIDEPPLADWDREDYRDYYHIIPVKIERKK